MSLPPSTMTRCPRCNGWNDGGPNDCGCRPCPYCDELVPHNDGFEPCEDCAESRCEDCGEELDGDGRCPECGGEE